MTKKIFTGIIMVALVVMICCAGLIMGVMYDYLGSQIYLDLENEARLVESGIHLGGEDYLEQLKQSETLTMRVTLIDASGVVLYDSQADALTMASHMEREEFREALTDGEGRAVRESETMAKETR